tara:strand:+ start:454 stop:813 length:360 start_codon:yes stop_codon:yes gene_type:complete
MDNQTVNIIVAVFSILIIIVFLVKIYLDYTRFKKLTKNSSFPPWPAKCPDYWKVRKGDNGDEDVICQNIHSIGICKTGEGTEGEMKFNESIFKGGQGQLNKCSWSKKCYSPWEGIDTIC